MYEWTFTIFFLLFGGYLQLVYQWGKTKTNLAGFFSSDPESLDDDSAKGPYLHHINLSYPCLSSARF